MMKQVKLMVLDNVKFRLVALGYLQLCNGI